jgi:hypothetical protein
VFSPICASTAPCKVCQTIASLFGVADFHRACADNRAAPLPLSGIPIYFYRCPSCGLLFTTACDAFSVRDFLELIYNDQYLLIDPEYKEQRPQRIAQFIDSCFGRSKTISILDYGGGNGELARALKRIGFTSLAVYDPFVPEFSLPPAGTYDLILSIEVMEHAAAPLELVRDIARFAGPTTVVLFSTLLQPPDILKLGMNWWYIGPRNGHLTLHTQKSLEALGAQLGWQLASFDGGLHLYYRQIPEWLKRQFG